MHIDDAIRKWKLDDPKGSYLGKGFYLNILINADDVVIIQVIENHLQKCCFILLTFYQITIKIIPLFETKRYGFLWIEIY